MPRFHFHVSFRGDLLEDRDGCNYFDAESARNYGRRLALDLNRTGNFAGAAVLMVDVLGRELARFPVDNVLDFARERRTLDAGSSTRRSDPDRLQG